MMPIQKLLAFLVVLGTLVVVHELGHYLVARLCGVKVLRFSVGMGKVIFSRRVGRDQTEWAISALPLGGYVKMLDAREQDISEMRPEDLSREFTRQSVWRRIAIVAAGPVANFFLAIALFSGLYMTGVPEPVSRLRAVPENTAAFQAGLRGGEVITAVNGEPVRVWSEMRWKLLQLALEKAPARLDVQRPDPLVSDGHLLTTVIVTLNELTPQDLEDDFLGKLGMDLVRPKAVLGDIKDNGPAMLSGLLQGDEVTRVNGTAVSDWQSFVALVSTSPGKPVQLTGKRGSSEFEIIVTPETQTEGGKAIGRIGVALSPQAYETLVVKDPPAHAVAKGAGKTWDTTILTLKMLGKIITGEASLKNITGPITIADYAGKTASAGIPSFLAFIAFISISLGVMNLLPIPVLDGGLLLYYSLEVLTGRPISERFGDMAQKAGIGILMTLMVVAFFNDIVRLMS